MKFFKKSFLWNTSGGWFCKSPLSALRQYLTIESPLKMMKSDFFFHAKSLFYFKDIYIFVMSFLAMWENG